MLVVWTVSMLFLRRPVAALRGSASLARRAPTTLGGSRVLGSSRVVSTSPWGRPVPEPRMSPTTGRRGGLPPLQATPVPVDEARGASTEKAMKWLRLGLGDEVSGALADMGLEAPSEIQRLVAPGLLAGENLLFAAETGSGKTLAYLAPVFAALRAREQLGQYNYLGDHQGGRGNGDDDGYFAENEERVERRPRCLVLVPTRELGSQVLAVAKTLSAHGPRLACRGCVGGSDGIGKQARSLGSSPVDVVVASPGRFVQLWRRGDVFVGRVSHVVIDEVDTMLADGFGDDIREILKATILFRQRRQLNKEVAAEKKQKKLEKKMKSRGLWTADDDDDADDHLQKSTTTRAAAVSSGRPPAQLIVASATLTKAVRRTLAPVTGSPSSSSSSSSDQTKKQDRDPAWTFLPKLRLVESSGTHRAVGSLQRVDVDLAGRDKLDLLGDVVDTRHGRFKKTLVFCNTVSSCRAVEYALREDHRAGDFLRSDYVNDDAWERRHRNADDDDDDWDDDDDDESSAEPPLDAGLLCYHGEMNSRARERNLAAFREAESSILVCTDLAARGLDVPDVDHVVNFDYPRSPIDYLHRAGRTARFGRPGRVTSLVAKPERRIAAAIAAAVDNGERLDRLVVGGTPLGAASKRLVGTAPRTRGNTGPAETTAAPPKRRPDALDSAAAAAEFAAAAKEARKQAKAAPRRTPSSSFGGGRGASSSSGRGRARGTTAKISVARGRRGTGRNSSDDYKTAGITTVRSSSSSGRRASGAASSSSRTTRKTTASSRTSWSGGGRRRDSDRRTSGAAAGGSSGGPQRRGGRRR